MNTNKGSIVKQSGNDVEGCRSEKVLVQPNMRVFLQYSVRFSDPVICFCMVTLDLKWSETKNLKVLICDNFFLPLVGNETLHSHTVCRKPYNFPFILSNVVVDIIRVRINAIRFILFEADVRTFEIRITA